MTRNWYNQIQKPSHTNTRKEEYLFQEHLTIKETCLYVLTPLKPHYYIEKLGFKGSKLFFLLLLKNIDYG